MRVGENPEKDKVVDNDAYHRIIIPVYAPHLDGYFENALDVTKLCIGSVIKTKHSQAAITVINNGCCAEVAGYLQGLFENGAIDSLVHHTSNLGKIDAVLPIAKQASEALITITDGDVLFKQGWMQAVEEVYRVFPEAGMVSPVPHGTTFYNHTINTLFDGALKRVLQFKEACDPSEMLRFAKSIGKEDTMYQNKLRLQYQLTVNRGETTAVVGCGHFVSTLRKEVFQYAPKVKSKLAYASKADRDYIDIPNEKAGLWRLATVGNYAYHMGNVPETWMQEVYNALSIAQGTTSPPPPLKRNVISFGIKKWVVRILMSSYFRSYFFKTLGLKNHANAY